MRVATAVSVVGDFESYAALSLADSGALLSKTPPSKSSDHLRIRASLVNFHYVIRLSHVTGCLATKMQKPMQASKRSPDSNPHALPPVTFHRTCRICSFRLCSDRLDVTAIPVQDVCQSAVYRLCPAEHLKPAAEALAAVIRRFALFVRRPFGSLKCFS